MYFCYLLSRTLFGGSLHPCPPCLARQIKIGTEASIVAHKWVFLSFFSVFNRSQRIRLMKFSLVACTLLGRDLGADAVGYAEALCSQDRFSLNIMLHRTRRRPLQNSFRTRNFTEKNERNTHLWATIEASVPILIWHARQGGRGWGNQQKGSREEITEMHWGRWLTL